MSKALRILPETNCYRCVSSCFPEETDMEEAGKGKVSLHADFSVNNHLPSSINSSGSPSRPTLIRPQLSKRRYIQWFSFLATLLWKSHFQEKIYLIIALSALSAMLQCMYSGLWNLVLTDDKGGVFWTYSVRLSLLLPTWLLCYCAHLSTSGLYSRSQPRSISKG